MDVFKGQRGLFSAARGAVDPGTGSGRGGCSGGVSSAAIVRERDDLIGKRFTE